MKQHCPLLVSSVVIIATSAMCLFLLSGCAAGLVSSLGGSLPMLGAGTSSAPNMMERLFVPSDPQLMAEKHFGVKRETVDGIVWRYQGNVLGSTDGVFCSDPDTIKGNVVIPKTLGGVTIVSLGPHLFMGCENLASVRIPDCVRTIGNAAFMGCTSLTTIQLPQSVTTLGDNVFSGCKSLSSIDFPQGIMTVGKGAFQGCSGLISVAIPNGVKVLEDNTFSGCFGLVTVSLPEGLVRIGDSAFHSPLPSQNCADIRAVKLPSTLVTIGESAFNGCSGLTKIVIPDNVTTIGNYAFNDCSSLKATYIGKKVVRLGTGAFRHTGLTHVYVAEGASVTLDDLHRAGIAEDCEVYRIYPDRRTERL